MQLVLPELGEEFEPEIRIGNLYFILDPEDDEFGIKLTAKILSHEFLHYLLHVLEGREAGDKLDNLGLT